MRLVLLYDWHDASGSLLPEVGQKPSGSASIQPRQTVMKAAVMSVLRRRLRTAALIPLIHNAREFRLRFFGPRVALWLACRRLTGDLKVFCDGP